MQAILVSTYADKPGEFMYTKNKETGEITGMLVRLPDNQLGILRFANHPEAAGYDTWVWNQNIEKPTLTPSINASYKDVNGNVKGWHGYLTDGYFKSC